ncbi:MULTISPECIES: IclR family transcriptional regulator [unclassified Caballeronia]|uniref:IclR family transcriptional regulator n=1 Tax=unclassified Caballeronia TaxID=2646786 RepID=UPI003ECF4F0D
MPKLATGQTLRSAERMLDVLKIFSTDEPSLTVAEITARLGLAPSTLRRILDILVQRGFVRLEPRSGKYSPFVEIVRLAAVAVQGNDLISGASQPLDDLRDKTGENVQLTVLVENDVVFVDRRVTNQTIKIFSPIGYRRPPWDGRASGQILLAWLAQPQLNAMLPSTAEWRPGQAPALASPKAFLSLLADVRSNGYAINDEYTERDVWAVAAPIRDHTREVVAAVSIPVLKSRATDPERVRALIDAVIAAGQDISRRLSYFE